MKGIIAPLTFEEWVDAYGDCPCGLEDVFEACPEHDRKEQQ